MTTNLSRPLTSINVSLPPLGARAAEHVIGEEVTLADGLALVPAEAAAQSGAGRLEATGGAAAAAAPSFAARRAAAEHLEDAALADEHLVHVEENVAAADDDALDGEVVADVLRLAHLVVHLL
ncbi:hypothetical protein TYRP_013345 [Tyrophagus putrescentiae]|nr:hypothetical protein TYRP_013345 [Tyrophagus putrescentiae]